MIQLGGKESLSDLKEMILEWQSEFDLSVILFELINEIGDCNHIANLFRSFPKTIAYLCSWT